MNPTKTICIHHHADFDGLFCRQIASRFLPPETNLIGWDYGEPEPVVPDDATLYIMDLSVPGLMNHPGLIWIDHHKSAIEKYPSTIPGYRIDGVAACRLAWQWFKHLQRPDHEQFELPTKQMFIDRTVDEPWAVRLAGEYDVWDKRDPEAELFQHGLRSGLIPWPYLFNHHESSDVVKELLSYGSKVRFAKREENETIIKRAGFDLCWEGLNFLACNAALFNSHLFTAGIKPEHDALIGFGWDGKKWRVSLYGAPGKPEVDLSLIAIKHGGGGHKQACGFTAKELPFKL